MNKTLERKLRARQEREDHIPMPCLSSPTPLRDYFIRKFSQKPIDRLARDVVRAKRKIRRASGILAKLYAGSPFARPLQVDVAINQLRGQLAQAEIDYRIAIATQPR